MKLIEHLKNIILILLLCQYSRFKSYHINKIFSNSFYLKCLMILKQQKFEFVLRDSIKFAFENRNASIEYVKCHAREMSAEVINAHIQLYVNDFSLSLGTEGRKAVQEIFRKIKQESTNIFLN